jgi:uncharacterized protein (UPF0303 family)
VTELAQPTRQELEALPRVEFETFGNSEAYALGTVASVLIVERELDLAVDVVLRGDLVYRAKLGTTGPGNDEWLAGKAATARRYGVPSLLVRRRIQDGEDVPLEDSMKPHGGSVPIFVNDELVATITMSGEPDHVDHQTCWDATQRYARAVA